MTSKTLPVPGDVRAEVDTLIDALHESGQRLEDLTEGEVDAVADGQGRAFLLRRAQEHLRQSAAAKQAAILNALPAHIALLDTQGFIIVVNAAWRRFARANALQGPRSGLGVNYLDVCDSARGSDASEARQTAAGIRSVLARESKSFSIEYPCHSPTEKRWFLLAVTPLSDQANGAVVMHLDITARKLGEAALAESEAGLHRAQVMAKLAHVITGPDGSFERWSDTLARFIGATSDRLPRTTRAWLRIIHPRDRSRFLERVIDAGTTRLRVEIDYRLRGADGRWIDVRQATEPLKNEAMESEARRWFTTLQDLTSERFSAEQLRTSEQRFRQMAEGIRDVFFLREVASDRVLYVSPAYEEIWGRSCESLYADPQSWYQAIHPEDRGPAQGRTAEGMAAGEYRFEYRIVRPDGSIRWIEAKDFPVRDHAGKVVRIAGVAEDITGRKRLEGEVLATRNQLQATLDAVPDLLFELGLDGCYQAIHSPSADLLPAPVETLLGKTVSEVLPADAAEVIVSALHEAHAEGRSAGKQFQLALPHGQLWFELSVSRMAASSGEEPRFICVSRDITVRKRALLESRESERRFREMLQNVELVSVMLDCEARITFCNECLLRLTGWTHDEVIGRNWHALFLPPETLDERNKGFAALLQDRPAARHREYEILTRTGERRMIRWNNSVLRSGAGEVIGTASIGADVTDQKQAEIRIRRLNRIYAVLSHINALIVRVRAREELFREACRIAVEHGGFLTAWIGVVDLADIKIVPVASAGMTPGFLAVISQPFASPEKAPLRTVLRVIREKTAVFCNDVQNDPNLVFKEELAELGARSLAVLPLRISDGVVGILALYSEEPGFFDGEEVNLLAEVAGNISFAIDHIESEKKLDYLAHYDVLTGLANRNLFLGVVSRYVRSAVRAGHKLGLFLIDLERFKNINDTFGRPAGDALLRQVAEWLTRNVGDSSLLARVGVDLFAVVLPEVRQGRDLRRLLDKKMADLLEQVFLLNDIPFRVAAKLGVALFPDDGANADTLLKNAEAALKAAKRSGDRYLFYSAKMTEMMAGKITLENQLRQAVHNGEFVLHYQPQTDGATGELVGAEALIRWNDPRTGLVFPDQIVPALEETGLIHEVGRWVLRKAIEDYLRWRAAGLDVRRVAVNVSPLQLRHRGFIDEIRQVATMDPQAASGLELEITEGVFMEDVEQSVATLTAIRALGVTIAIDDFGTGFSSLAYLSKLPVDKLKIDRAFVVGMSTASEGLALMSTIINLAHSLKLKVVAEGVETEEQSRLLRLLNCDGLQGYLFSKPLPTDMFEARYLPVPEGTSAGHEATGQGELEPPRSDSPLT